MILAVDLRWLSAMAKVALPAANTALSEGSLLHSSLESWIRFRVLKIALTKLLLQSGTSPKPTTSVTQFVKFFHFGHVLLSQ